MMLLQQPITPLKSKFHSFYNSDKELLKPAENILNSPAEKSAGKKVLNIKARGTFPANVLSNFSKTKFVFDGVQINSIEGFLQALKVKDTEEQKRICALSGFDAKKASNAIKRDKSDILLFWNGKSFRKDSKEFKNLISKVVQKKDKTDSKGFFKFAGKKIASVNSFLLGLKVKDPDKQKEIFTVLPSDVKKTAKTILPEYDTRTLYWGGKSFSRDSNEYKDLLKRVYSERFSHDSEFRKALRASKNYVLCHSIGKSNSNETILTEKEFTGLLKEMQKKDKFVYKLYDYLFFKLSKIIEILKKCIKR